mmetsp:Transcript_21008/g.45785  ORF Transcript_21008/g.45785 Transcript_21008/m.45785 type:complete len:327 (-) Transcript_21008:88-1068(-)
MRICHAVAAVAGLSAAAAAGQAMTTVQLGDATRSGADDAGGGSRARSGCLGRVQDWPDLYVAAAEGKGGGVELGAMSLKCTFSLVSWAQGVASGVLLETLLLHVLRHRKPLTQEATTTRKRALRTSRASRTSSRRTVAMPSKARAAVKQKPVASSTWQRLSAVGRSVARLPRSSRPALAVGASTCLLVLMLRRRHSRSVGPRQAGAKRGAVAGPAGPKSDPVAVVSPRSRDWPKDGLVNRVRGRFAGYGEIGGAPLQTYGLCKETPRGEGSISEKVVQLQRPKKRLSSADVKLPVAALPGDEDLQGGVGLQNLTPNYQPERPARPV